MHAEMRMVAVSLNHHKQAEGGRGMVGKAKGLALPWQCLQESRHSGQQASNAWMSLARAESCTRQISIDVMMMAEGGLAELAKNCKGHLGPTLHTLHPCSCSPRLFNKLC